METGSRDLARNWRGAVLLVLLIGPVLIYVVLGSLWLKERGWLLYATLIWLAIGVLFGVLAEFWTRRRRPILPPIDWEMPGTFAPRDQAAWDLVQREAGTVDALPADRLSRIETYLEVGQRLAQALARHYQPDATQPLERVPVVELLTALELAAEDLNGLCRQIPGGDLITPGHWKQAVKASEWITRANDLYSYVLPLIQPVSGLARLGSRQLMVKPAWKSMQNNLMRWFWQAYVNRLGARLIELYSGRLAIGADQYRRLTGRINTDMPAVSVALVGSSVDRIERLRAAIDQARAGDLTTVRARLISQGIDGSRTERLAEMEWAGVPAYSAFESPRKEGPRDRSSRKSAIAAAVNADLVVLVIEGAAESRAADLAFLRDWDAWFADHPTRERPPALVVMTGADTSEWGGPWAPPYDWTHPRRPREQAVRAAIDALRGQLPATVPEPIAVGIFGQPTFGVQELLLPSLAIPMARAARVGLLRRLHRSSERSVARRLLNQIGAQGKWLWNLGVGRKRTESAV